MASYISVGWVYHGLCLVDGGECVCVGGGARG